MSGEPLISLEGNLGRKPELGHTTEQNRPVTTLRVIVNPGRYVDGVRVDEEPIVVDATCFGDTAENVVASLDKGMRVVIVGRVQGLGLREHDGETKAHMRMLVDSIGPGLRFDTSTVHRRGRRREGAEHVFGPAPVQDPWTKRISESDQ